MQSDIRSEKFELGTSNIILYSDGYIKYLLPVTYEASCQMFFLHFPFDQQECNIVFSSWTYDKSKFNLQHTPENAAVSAWFEKNSGWELIEFSAYIRETFYSCCDYEFTENVFTLVIRRRFLLQVCYLFIPNLLINLTAAVSFLLPCDSSERCTLGITIYLSMIVYLLLLQELIPASDTVPYIVRYIVSTICMVSCSQVVTICVLHLHYNGAHDNLYQVPRFVRRYIMHGLAWMLRMNHKLVSDAEHQIKMASLPREIAIDRRRGNLIGGDDGEIVISLDEMETEVNEKEKVSDDFVKKLDALDKVRDSAFGTILESNISSPTAPEKRFESSPEDTIKTQSLGALSNPAGGAFKQRPAPKAGRGRGTAAKRRTSKSGRSQASIASKASSGERGQQVEVHLLHSESITDSIVNAKQHMADHPRPPSPNHHPEDVKLQLTPSHHKHPKPPKAVNLLLPPNEDEEIDSDVIRGLPRPPPQIFQPKFASSMRRKTSFKPRHELAAKTSSVRVLGGGALPALVRRKDLKTASDLLLYKLLRLSEISTVLRLEEERKVEVRCEWQQLAMLVDRLFLLIFVIGTITLWGLYFNSIPPHDREAIV